MTDQINDALGYARTSTNLTPLEAHNKTNVQFAATDNGDITPQINSFLDKTTIKRACCMGRAGPKNPNDLTSTGVKVKIPIPTGYNTANTGNPMYDKFGYIEKTVYIPQELCDANSLEQYNSYCDSFMDVYCANQFKVFQEMLGDEKDDGSIWTQYLPECSCYGYQDNPIYKNAQHNCFMIGCSGAAKHSNVYLSPDSRKDGDVLPCSATFCSSVVNASDITAGGNANFNTAVQQNCGQQIAQAETQAASAAASAKAAADTAAAKAAQDQLAAAAKAKADADVAASQAKSEEEVKAVKAEQEAANAQLKAATEQVQAVAEAAAAVAPESTTQEQSGSSRTTWIIVIVALCLFLLSAIGGLIIWKKRQNNL